MGKEKTGKVALVKVNLKVRTVAKVTKAAKVAKEGKARTERVQSSIRRLHVFALLVICPTSHAMLSVSIAGPISTCNTKGNPRETSTSLT